LIALNGLEQTLKVAGAKAIKVLTLDDLEEDCRAIHDVLGKQLQKVASSVKVDQDR
jgi:hypothetical protein